MVHLKRSCPPAFGTKRVSSENIGVVLLAGGKYHRNGVNYIRTHKCIHYHVIAEFLTTKLSHNSEFYHGSCLNMFSRLILIVVCVVEMYTSEVAVTAPLG